MFSDAIIEYCSDSAIELIGYRNQGSIMTLDAEKLSNDDLDVDVTDDALVVRATIDRPDNRNALNENVMMGLKDVLDAADESDTRVVVIRGAEANFSSGGDLAEMPIGQGAQEYRKGFSAISELFEKIWDTSAVTVAAVEGYCLAGGCGLAAACEFVVAEEGAKFGTPEVDVGLFPVQAMVPITRCVNEKKALKLLFTGEKIEAEKAEEIGLVTEVYPGESFDESLDELVNELASKSPVMISMGKEAYYNQRDMGARESLSYLKEVIALLAMSDDTEEGINAFLMDREPEWKGR